jgi:hypothetical protein
MATTPRQPARLRHHAWLPRPRMPGVFGGLWGMLALMLSKRATDNWGTANGAVAGVEVVLIVAYLILALRAWAEEVQDAKDLLQLRHGTGQQFTRDQMVAAQIEVRETLGGRGRPAPQPGDMS